MHLLARLEHLVEVASGHVARLKQRLAGDAEALGQGIRLALLEGEQLIGGLMRRPAALNFNFGLALPPADAAALLERLARNAL